MPQRSFFIRPLDPVAKTELAYVADRMRQTLVEVEGDTGATLYTPDWLQDRAAFHLDQTRCTGAIFVAIGDEGELVGHVIVRIERHENGTRFGLFSTTWVEPSVRRLGIANRLLTQGEAWMQERSLSEAATWTSATNHKLIALHAKRGYVQTDAGPNEVTGTIMVRLTRTWELQT